MTRSGEGADIVYTDVWASMSGERASRQVKKWPTGDPDLVKGKSRLYLHALPSGPSGEEVTNEVADSANSVIFDQAENRMHTQKALMALIM
jgi:ornithine carbamoyltransferase